MSNVTWEAHLERLRAATTGKFSRKDIVRWIETNTFLKGEPFSFKDHEYAIQIVEDDSESIVVTKPSQVGMSETIARLLLARAAITPMNIIYVMPTHSAATDFAKGRVNEIISESPYLSNAIDKGVDNVSIKKIGYSYIFFKGSSKDSQAISRPASAVICDEYNYCSETIVAQYQSRLNHSERKERLFFSTPTLPGRGVSAMLEESKQHYRMVKCCHCNTWSWPTLPDDIRIPGLANIDWPTLNKSKLATIDYREAYFAFPQ